ncbi:MAG: PP2C family serine/threonine-protein phosphatase [Alphaproteobacteria bacterium]
MAWRWAAASAIGTAHIRAGLRLQDALAVAACGPAHVLAVVADGAGSAAYGSHGAWLACRHLNTAFRAWVAANDGLPDDETLAGWIGDLRGRIAAAADRRDCAPRQFAATLAAVLVAPGGALALHVGDSAIVGRRDADWEIVCWPENGEYAATTYFITDDPAPRLNIVRLPPAHDAFALFTDGIGDLALDHAGRRAHRRFFDPMIGPVDRADAAGRLPELSAKLRGYLAGPSVCARTDDDKTLVLMSAA